MKLSEAIIDGSNKTRAKKFGLISLRQGVICTCALGAAAYSVGIINDSDWGKDDPYAKLRETFPCLTDDEGILIEDWIINLVDNEGKTREEVADWAAKLGY